jgi:phosphoenolpyruvate phosphomutase
MQNAKAIAGTDGKSIIGILTENAVLEKKPLPLLSFDDRINLAQSLKPVDLVIPQETYSPIPNLEMLRPNICMECIAHDRGDVEKVRSFMSSIGGQVIVTPYYPDVSSTIIKEKIKEEKR